MECRLLLDECVPFALSQGLRRQCPNRDILQVGEPDAPTKGTLDPDLLLFCEAQKRMLVSGDRSTLHEHINLHRAAGNNSYGVALISRGYTFARIVEDLVLILECSSADEWVNDLVYLPSLARGSQATVYAAPLSINRS
ncbi:MAG: DUF5615 family PIN-like protein [Pirellulales bacterium]